MTYQVPEKGSQNWNESLQTLFNQVDSDIQGKAPAIHSHGASGEVAAIGLSSARPAVANGFIYSESDTGDIVVLDSTGAVTATLATETYCDELPVDIPHLISDNTYPVQFNETTLSFEYPAATRAIAWGNFFSISSSKDYRVKITGFMSAAEALKNINIKVYYQATNNPNKSNLSTGWTALSYTYWTENNTNTFTIDVSDLDIPYSAGVIHFGIERESSDTHTSTFNLTNVQIVAV